MGEVQRAARRISRKVAAVELGISRQRVEQLLKRWPETETNAGVDIVELTRLRDDNADPLRRAVYEQTRKLKATQVDEPEAPAPGAAAATSKVSPFNDARTRREVANAQIAELKAAEESGRLIPRDEVYAREFAIARKLRDRINGFPTKLQQFMTPDAMAMLIEECRALVTELQADAERVSKDEF